MAFLKVNKGQKFQPTASTWNGFVDAANWVQQQQQNTLQNIQRLQNQTGMVLAKNVDSSDADMLGVVALTGIQIKPNGEQAERTFIADVPFFQFERVTEDNKNQGYATAILQQPIKEGESGKALVMGVTPAYVNIQNDNHGFAVADTSTSFGLKSSSDGDIKILWKPSGTGKQLCMVAVGLGGATAYKSIFKLQQKDNEIEIVNGADEDDSNAGFVFCNGMFKEIPKGSVSASSGYVVIQATLGEQDFTAEFKITTDIAPTQEVGYYVLGKVQSATGGGGYEVFQYYHATPHIIICGECEQQQEQE